MGGAEAPPEIEQGTIGGTVLKRFRCKRGVRYEQP